MLALCTRLIAAAPVLLGQAPQAPAPQQPAPAPTNDTGDEWLPLDEIRLIVNEEIVTHADMIRRVELIRRRYPISTPQELQELQLEIVVRETDRILGGQAGQDMGLAPEEIENRVEEYMNRAREQHGVIKFSEFLREQNLDSKRWRETLSSDLYRQLWEGVLTGTMPDHRGRPVQDRFVRPGTLHRYYQLFQENPELVAQIGGEREKYVLQDLVVGIDEHGDVEAARKFVSGLRIDALAGEDFDALVEEHSLRPEDKGLTPAMEVEQIGHPDVQDFVRKAGVGDVSPPIPILRDGRIEAWRIVRLYEHREPVIPKLDDPEVQKKISGFVQRNRDEIRLHLALDSLYKAAYIWPPETLNRRPPLPPQLSEL